MNMHIKARFEHEEIIKKSRFIGIAQRIDSLEDVQEKLSSLRKEHTNANHICYAYQLGDLLKSNDDHEPSGTAGIPILESLKYSQLEDCLIAVVRYFGGIKLGAGGLIRAYSSVSSATLENAAKTKEIHYYHFSLEYPYTLSSRIETWLYRNQTNPIFNYGDHVYCEFDFPEEDISQEIQDLSKGQATLTLLKIKKKEVDID